MNKKNLVLIGIAVCTILLASPVLASAGYSKIYGNANEDDVLDMRDVTYLKLVIFGKKPATTFADANYDGKVSMLDIGQTKLIILGKEKKLTLVDQADRTVTILRPIERVVSCSIDDIRALIALGATDKLVGVSSYVARYKSSIIAVQACPRVAELPGVGLYQDLNTELIVSLGPDVIFAYGVGPGYIDIANTVQETTSIPVVCVKTSYNSEFDLEMYRLMSKIIGKEERAEELISYANEKISEITEVTAEISNSEKQKVYFFTAHRATDITRAVPRYAPIDIAGGIIVSEECGMNAIEVSREQIIVWNPDIILIHGIFPPHTFSIEGIISDPDFQTINAVKNHSVNYTKGFNIGWDPATGLTECFYMAKLFHPDKFEDLNEEKEGNEILERFYEVDDFYTELLDKSDRYRWE